MTCIVSNPWNILDEDSNQVILEIVLSPLKPRNMENWKPNIMLVKQCHNMSEASHMEWWFCLSHSNKNGDSAIRDAGSYSNKTTNPRVNRSTFSGQWYPYDFSAESAAPFFSPTLRCHQRWLAGNPPLMEDFSSDKNLILRKGRITCPNYPILLGHDWYDWLINHYSRFWSRRPWLWFRNSGVFPSTSPLNQILGCSWQVGGKLFFW